MRVPWRIPETIDNEVKIIIDAQYQVALEILKNSKPVLEAGAELLLEKEKIEGAQLKQLMEKLAV